MNDKNQRQTLDTLVEYESKLILLVMADHKAVDVVSKAFIRLFKALLPWMHTLTADNGRGFSQHQKIGQALNAKFYFVHSFAL